MGSSNAQSAPPEPPIGSGPHSGTQEDSEAPTAAPPHDVRLCGICEENPSKYKCPRCYLPYCSVACNKIHRENHPPDPTPAPKPSPPPAVSATATTAPEESNEDSSTHQSDHRFGTLERSKELQYLFKKYPRLPKQLLDIHAATLPPPSEKSRIPASLLKDLPVSSNGWDRDKAMASGKEALRKARGAKGVDGEALREYSELVLHLTKDKANNR
ncbi:hypothetical protein V2G26_001142 [Clonostachys chloroleuca]